MDHLTLLIHFVQEATWYLYSLLKIFVVIIIFLTLSPEQGKTQNGLHISAVLFAF